MDSLTVGDALVPADDVSEVLPAVEFEELLGFLMVGVLVDGEAFAGEGGGEIEVAVVGDAVFPVVEVGGDHGYGLMVI